MRKKLLSVLGIIIFIFILILFEKKGLSNETNTSIYKSGFYFDTIITITLYDTNDEAYLDECFALADKYEHLLSASRTDSDVSKINAANGNPVTVSDETIALLERGIYYGDLSEGRFDITVGKLSSLWDFSHNEGTIPDEDAIKDALATIDYHNIQINGNTVTLKNPTSAIDLGGIAKGYIADEMKAYLNEQGITSGTINLGGNVLTIGPKANDEDYRIGIQKPFAEDGDALAAISIKDASVVSSGVYERYFEKNGTLYHHILNPKDGYPYQNELLGVTIICKNSVDGDGLSTVCFSLGLADGLQLIESLPDTEAIFITNDNEIHTTSGIGTTIPFEILNE